MENVVPYKIIFNPTYLLLKASKSFYGVKGPLDFFSPEDLVKIVEYDYLYFSEFSTSLEQYCQSGRMAKLALSRDDRIIVRNKTNLYPDVFLSPSPFESSESILKIIGALWWHYSEFGTGVEPFFLVAFVNELCTPVSETLLIKARGRGREALENSLLVSSLVIFLALHLSYCNLNFLNNLRNYSFEEALRHQLIDNPETEVEEIINISKRIIFSSNNQLIKANFIFCDEEERISVKLRSRIELVKKKYISKGKNPPSIYGKQGFING